MSYSSSGLTFRAVPLLPWLSRVHDALQQQEAVTTLSIHRENRFRASERAIAEHHHAGRPAHGEAAGPGRRAEREPTTNDRARGERKGREDLRRCLPAQRFELKEFLDLFKERAA